jgi:5-methylcytosine-specific restriction endonuclease McrA
MGTKYCCHCKKELSLDSFQKNRVTKDGLQYRCKACTKLASRACRARRSHLWLEKISPWDKRSEANRLRANASARIRRAKSPEKERAQNRRWREGNPFVVAMTAARNRARELKVESTLTAGEWRDVVERANFICHICGDEVCFEIGSPNRLSLDHVIPLSRGGTNVKENVAPAHNRCNKARSNMTMSEFGVWLNRVLNFRSNDSGRQS